MSEQSKIEWTDATFNPWLGCTKVSPACANCYAESWAKRSGLVGWGESAERRRTSEAYWKQPLKWNRQAAESGEVFRVFGGSLCDWLDARVPISWLADYLNLIWRCRDLQWLLLTKRIENFSARIQLAAHELFEWGQRDIAEDVMAWLSGAVPPFIALGVTAENQRCADERIPLLLQTPAAIRFVSAEPLLGPIEFSDVTKRSDAVSQLGKKSLNGIHWVIVGGESGPNARPMHPDWARSLRDQCRAAGVPYFFKQNGEWLPVVESGTDSDGRRIHYVVTSLNQLQKSPQRADFHDFGDGQRMIRVGKKAAGRLLDGREWSDTPTA